jgi:hypothetical protein
MAPKRQHLNTAFHTRAWLTHEENLGTIGHMLGMQHREAVALRAAGARMYAYAGNKMPDLTTKAGRAKLERSLRHFNKTIDASIGRLGTGKLWVVVMLVTCVEAYLHDVLSIAASVDPKLMSKSEQPAHYADVIEAASLDELANELRARWARGWLRDGGPTRWLSRLHGLGARGYPDKLALRLERIWGIRHVVVHAAGVATADFVKRHPGVVAARCDRLRVTDQDLIAFLEAAKHFTEPTEAFFLSRYPAIPRMKSLGGS